MLQYSALIGGYRRDDHLSWRLEDGILLLGGRWSSGSPTVLVRDDGTTQDNLFPFKDMGEYVQDMDIWNLGVSTFYNFKVILPQWLARYRGRVCHPPGVHSLGGAHWRPQLASAGVPLQQAGLGGRHGQHDLRPVDPRLLQLHEGQSRGGCNR